jgi:hypothetical protein
MSTLHITPYERDVFAWANEQAAFIRAGRFELLDLENIAEEILDVGKSEKRELASRMAVLLAHLLKCKYQPEKLGSSWRRTIKEQRKEVGFCLKETPSLKPQLDGSEWISGVWSKAVLIAANETGLGDFPEVCPWDMNNVLQEGWLPE